MDEYVFFGYDGKAPVPCSPRASLIALAVVEVVSADRELDEAKLNVPSYTDQWSPEDYYAKEQEAYYRAAEMLEIALKDEEER